MLSRSLAVLLLALALSGCGSLLASMESGPIEDSPLRHAPHTVEDLLGGWDRTYSRELGGLPVPGAHSAYFPPVSRIDGASGDRNLICTCEPLHELAADPGS